MYAFQIKHIEDAQLLIATNAHVACEDSPIQITASSKTGIVSSVSNVSVRDLVDAKILDQDAKGVCRLRNMTDASPEAQAVVWGEIVRGQFCSCATEPDVSRWQRYERHDEDGVYTGEHGYACPDCRGIVQTG